MNSAFVGYEELRQLGGCYPPRPLKTLKCGGGGGGGGQTKEMWWWW